MLVLPITTVARRPLPACGAVGSSADHGAFIIIHQQSCLRERPDTGTELPHDRTVTHTLGKESIWAKSEKS
jgi:hypothetical protein